MNVVGRIERLEAQAVEGRPACWNAALPVVLAYEGAPPGYRPAAEAPLRAVRPEPGAAADRRIYVGVEGSGDGIAPLSRPGTYQFCAWSDGGSWPVLMSELKATTPPSAP